MEEKRKSGGEGVRAEEDGEKEKLNKNGRQEDRGEG
jgi:hypothetical protein